MPSIPDIPIDPFPTALFLPISPLYRIVFSNIPACWYLYQGEIYYMERMMNDDGTYVTDKTIKGINLDKGDKRIIYQSEKPKMDYFWFFIREDGMIFCEWGEKGNSRRDIL